MGEDNQLIPADQGDYSLIPQNVPTAQAQQLTQQFYEWELRGRGWKCWDYPVILEPPFRPFLFHTLFQEPITDDGRTEHEVTRAIKAIGRFLFRKRAVAQVIQIPEEEPELIVKAIEHVIEKVSG